MCISSGWDAWTRGRPRGRGAVELQLWVEDGSPEISTTELQISSFTSYNSEKSEMSYLPGWRGVSYTNWGGFPIQYVSWCILHVSCMYPACIHQDTSRYIEIQQDTFVSVTLAIKRKCILPRDMYPSLRYIQDTFKIHCILTLRYMTHKIHSP